MRPNTHPTACAHTAHTHTHFAQGAVNRLRDREWGIESVYEIGLICLWLADYITNSYIRLVTIEFFPISLYLISSASSSRDAAMTQTIRKMGCGNLCFLGFSPKQIETQIKSSRNLFCEVFYIAGNHSNSNAWHRHREAKSCVFLCTTMEPYFMQGSEWREANHFTMMFCQFWRSFFFLTG